jgi:WD40 repeat protein
MNCRELSALVQDIRRFALYSRAAIEQAPLQVYYSALCFAPMKSIVRRQFIHKTSKWLRKGPERETHWSATLQTLDGHSDAVNTVAFSPDGKHLASGSDDSGIRIWDADRGATLHTLTAHLGHVRTVAFSPDGRLASGSADRTIRIWDIITGTTLKTFNV